MANTIRLFRRIPALVALAAVLVTAAPTGNLGRDIIGNDVIDVGDTIDVNLGNIGRDVVVDDAVDLGDLVDINLGNVGRGIVSDTIDILRPPNSPNDGNSEIIPSAWIVTLRPNMGMASHLEWVEGVHKREAAASTMAGITKTFDKDEWRGYAGQFNDATIAAILASPDVGYSHSAKNF